MSKIIKSIVFCVLSMTCLTKVYAKEKILKFPEYDYSAETIHYNLKGLIVSKDFIYMMPTKGDFVVKTPIKLNKKTRLEKFGKFTDSIRMSFPELKKFGPWNGGFVANNKLYFLNSSEVGLGEVIQKYKTVIFRGIPYDTINPTKDRGGIAPLFERKEYRKKFLKSFKKTRGEKFVGVDLLPKSKNARQRLIVLTRIKGFPFIRLKCSKDDQFQCIVEDGCNVSGYNFSNLESLSGLKYLPKLKMILVGDLKKKEILKFKYNSCNNIRYIGSINLPAKIKKLGSLAVDEKMNLWITSQVKDDYNNASLYYWEEKDWR